MEWFVHLRGFWTGERPHPVRLRGHCTAEQGSARPGLPPPLAAYYLLSADLRQPHTHSINISLIAITLRYPRLRNLKLRNKLIKCPLKSYLRLPFQYPRRTGWGQEIRQRAKRKRLEEEEKELNVLPRRFTLGNIPLSLFSNSAWSSLGCGASSSAGLEAATPWIPRGTHDVTGSHFCPKHAAVALLCS